jgi:hypothetical protein
VVLERVAEVSAAGGLAGVRGLTQAVAERLAAAVEAIPTEASAQALRCFRGETGPTTIRGGRRTVELTPAGGLTFYLDVPAALRSAARLAAAVRDAEDLALVRDSFPALEIVVIPEDPTVLQSDREARSAIDVDPDSPAVQAVGELAGRISRWMGAAPAGDFLPVVQ